MRSKLLTSAYHAPRAIEIEFETTRLDQADNEIPVLVQATGWVGFCDSSVGHPSDWIEDLDLEVTSLESGKALRPTLSEQEQADKLLGEALNRGRWG